MLETTAILISLVQESAARAMATPPEPTATVNGWMWGQQLFPDEGAALMPAGPVVDRGCRPSRSVRPVNACEGATDLVKFLATKRALLREVSAREVRGAGLAMRVAKGGLTEALKPLASDYSGPVLQGLRDWVTADLQLRAGLFEEAATSAEQARAQWAKAGHQLAAAYASMLSGDALARAPSACTWNVVPGKNDGSSPMLPSRSRRGDSALSAMHYARASTRYLEAAEDFGRLGHGAGFTRATMRRASLALSVGNDAKAASLAQDARASTAHSASPLVTALADYGVLLATGEFGRAEQEGLTEFAAWAKVNGCVGFATGLALVYRAAGVAGAEMERRNDVSRPCFKAACELEQRMDNGLGQIATLTTWGMVECRVGRVKRGRALYSRALRTCLRHKRLKTTPLPGANRRAHRKLQRWLMRELGSTA